MPLKTSVLTLSLLAFVGCSSMQPMCPDYGTCRICPQEPRQMTAMELAACLAALEKEHRQLTDELATAKRENGSLRDRVKLLDSQLADRDPEIASLRSSVGDSSKLASQLT